jgi:hypothetical protein
MAQFSVYSDLKDSDFIYAQWSKGITANFSSDANLSAYYRMGSDTSKAYPTIADSSSNSNDGTMTSMASDNIVQQMISGYDMGAFESSSEELGAELNPNPTFSNFTGDIPDGWTVVGDDDAGNNISQGSAGGLRIQSDGTAIYAQLADVTTSGKIYKYSITLANLTDDDFNFNNGGTTFFTANGKSEGTYTGHFEAVSTLIRILRLGNCDGEVTAFSIKEVLQSDLSDTYPAIIDVNEPVLGAELWDADASTFDSGTHSWVKYGNNTIANDNGALKITYVNNALGAYVWLKDASDLSSDLTVGKTYKFTFDAKVSSGASVDVTISTLAGSPQVITETSFTTKSIYFTAENTNSTYVDTRNMGSGEIIYLDNFSLKEIQGNVGTMTQMDGVSNLVYSSVLPDQSFLTGVNSAYNFIDLDGTDAYVDIDSNFDLDISNDWSISAWFNIDVTNQYQAIFSQTISSSNRIGLVADNLSKIRASTYNGSAYTAVSSSTSISAGNWHHVVFTNSNNTLNLYLDTVAQAGTANFGLINTNATRIGSLTNNTYPFNGKIGQVTVFNKELSSTEVSAIYNAGRNSNLLDTYSDNIRQYFVFGSLDSKTGLPDTDSTIYDRSGNSNHGTTSGTATEDLKSSPNAEPNGYSKGDTNRSNNTP